MTWQARAPRCDNTRTARPASITRTGLLPLPFYSPVATPHIMAVMTISDMKAGHATAVPRLLLATPCVTALPNRNSAMTAASSQ